MIKCTCNYVLYPKTGEITEETSVIAKYQTETANLPEKYRSDSKITEFSAKGKGLPTPKKYNVILDGDWYFSAMRS